MTKFLIEDLSGRAFNEKCPPMEASNETAPE
jgi:hypothetical protein